MSSLRVSMYGGLISREILFLVARGRSRPPRPTRSISLRTGGFANLPGARTPDAIIAAGKLPFFATGGDTASFGSFDS
jgi:hypothetical protein